MDNDLSHLNDSGQAIMVNVSDKQVTRRKASACAIIVMNPETLNQILDSKIPKGDVFAAARIAGIMAAKKTSDLIPLCHPLSLSSVKLDIKSNKNNSTIEIMATCSLDGKTGVEMEALTAASVAALTVYDMCKAIDRAMSIVEVKLVHKSGGKSGEYKLP